ncbi:hypothetical protein L7F22_067269 [Adiantum nelumboides]|nr:hypothetical protein [Adiantum nelumboides]
MANIYEFAKGSFEPLKSGGISAESLVRIVVGHVYQKIEGKPCEALLFVDKKVDGAVGVIGGAIPQTVKDVTSQAWKEFVCGGVAAAMGESLMHPVDTVKMRMQSGSSFLSTVRESTRLSEVLKVVLKHDGYRGLYQGLPIGMAGSFAAGATYFGLIEMARAWINERHLGLSGPLTHFCAVAVGDSLGFVTYVPCEIIKQRMQIQGSP